MVGTALAQGVAFVALPFISRLYGPAIYGQFSTYLVWVGLIVILATLQYQHAIILPRLEKNAISVLKASCAVVIVVSVCGFVITLVIFKLWWVQPNAPLTAGLMGLATAVGGFGQLIQGLAIRLARYSTIAYASVVRAIACASLQLLMGWRGGGPEGLLLGYIVGDALALIVMTSTMSSKLVLYVKTRFNPIRTLAAFRRYIDFAQFGVPQEFVNSLSQGLPVLLLGYGYGPASAGAYASAARLLGAPVQLIGNAVRPVVYRELAGLTGNVPDQVNLYRKATIWLLVPATICMVVLYPWLDDLTLLVLGKDWSLASEYAPVLAIWFALAIGNSPSTAVFRIKRRQDLNLVYNIILLVIRALVLLIAMRVVNSVVAVNLYAVVGILMNIIYIGLGYRVLMAGRRTQ